MAVGEKDSIKFENVLADRLLAEIGSGINEYALAAELNQNRGAGTTVVRVVRTTHIAIAPDGWHAHGRAAAQDRERSLHRLVAAAVEAGVCGGRASALVTSTYAMRSSYRTFCRKFSSTLVRLPLVFSDSKLSVSMVWRAPIRSTRGWPPCSCISPSWSIADI